MTRSDVVVVALSGDYGQSRPAVSDFLESCAQFDGVDVSFPIVDEGVGIQCDPSLHGDSVGRGKDALN
jgi:hypothetical protein